MQTHRFGDIAIGTELPGFTTPPISRLALALYAGASGDHNPIHVDIDFAKKAGMPDVFAHGMLSMAWLGRLLTQWVDQRQLRQFGVRFAGITHLGHQLTCSGNVVEAGAIGRVDRESKRPAPGARRHQTSDFGLRP